MTPSDRAYKVARELTESWKGQPTHNLDFFVQRIAEALDGFICKHEMSAFTEFHGFKQKCIHCEKTYVVAMPKKEGE